MTVLQFVNFYHVPFKPELLQWAPETWMYPTGQFIDIESARKLAAAHNAAETLHPTGLYLEVDVRWIRIIKYHYAGMN